MKLTATQRLLLEACTRDPRTGHGHPIGIAGAAQWRAARDLARRALGAVERVPTAGLHTGRFMATSAGLAAVALAIDNDQLACRMKAEGTAAV